jgi:hypothetical protein
MGPVAPAAGIGHTPATIAPGPAVFRVAPVAGSGRPGWRDRTGFNKGGGLQAEARLDNLVRQPALPGDQDIPDEGSVIPVRQSRARRSNDQDGEAQSDQEFQAVQHPGSLGFGKYIRYRMLLRRLHFQIHTLAY